MSLTQDYTFQYSDTGVILNTDTTPTSPFVDVTSVQGLSNSPYRITARAREGQDGGFVDADFEDMRIIVIDGNIYGPAAGLETFLDSMKFNFAPQTTPQPFYFTSQAVGQRLVMCKSLGLRYDWASDRGRGVVPFQIQLQAEDPTIYGDPATSVVTGIGGASSSRGYNKLFNFGYGGATGTAGSVNCINSGNKPADATLTITGAVSDAVIVNDTTGDRLNFIGYTVNLGEVLTINLRNKTVVLNGTANRRSALNNSSSWFLLPPGTTVVRFLGNIVSGTPQLTVTFRSAYR